MSNYVEKNQIRMFAIIVIAIPVVCGLAYFIWGKPPSDSANLEASFRTFIGALCAIGAGGVVGIQMLAHDYEWWGNAKGSIAFIAGGVVLSVGGALYDIFRLLRPFFV